MSNFFPTPGDLLQQVLNCATMVGMALAAPADSFGGRLAQARRFAGVEQDEMAVRLGISRRTLYSWEKNKTTPKVDQLFAWASATGFPVSFFIDDLPEEGGHTVPVGELAMDLMPGRRYGHQPGRHVTAHSSGQRLAA